jgi:hypothetical protein
MLATGDADDDFDVQLVEGRAELLDCPTETMVPGWPGHEVRRPAARSPARPREFAATYSQAIRIAPTRFLGWTGRSRLSGAAAA